MKYRVLIGINFPKPGVVVIPGQPLKDRNRDEQRAEPGEIVDLEHLNEGALKFYLDNACIAPVEETGQDGQEGGN